MTAFLMAGVAAGLVATSCTARSDFQHGTPPPFVDRIVTTERRPHGAALVFIDESGRRTGELTKALDSGSIDSQPAWSPRADWIAFTSNRGRGSVEKTSLYAVRAVPGGEIVRFTRGPFIDRDPEWTPKGDALVYASSRGGRFFDLFVQKIVIEDGTPRPLGSPRRLTHTPNHALAPALSANGRSVAFMAVDPVTGNSSLWRIPLKGGRARRVTRGPGDSTPAWIKGDKELIFAAPARGQRNTNLYTVSAREQGKRKIFIANSDSDQSGPVVVDDAFVFATAVYRSQKSGKPILSSVVVAELSAPSPVWRALHDPSFVESRISVAISPRGIDRSVIRKNPLYSRALRRAISRYLSDLKAALRERAQQERQQKSTGKRPRQPQP